MKMECISFNFSPSFVCFMNIWNLDFLALKKIHKNAQNDAQVAPDLADLIPMECKSSDGEERCSQLFDLESELQLWNILAGI